MLSSEWPELVSEVGEYIWQDADVLSGNNSSLCDVLCHLFWGTVTWEQGILLWDFKLVFDGQIVKEARLKTKAASHTFLYTGNIVRQNHVYVEEEAK